jgi:hypothetical protein
LLLTFFPSLQENSVHYLELPTALLLGGGEFNNNSAGHVLSDGELQCLFPSLSFFPYRGVAGVDYFLFCLAGLVFFLACCLPNKRSVITVNGFSPHAFTLLQKYAFRNYAHFFSALHQSTEYSIHV